MNENDKETEKMSEDDDGDDEDRGAVKIAHELEAPSDNSEPSTSKLTGPPRSPLQTKLDSKYSKETS